MGTNQEETEQTSGDGDASEPDTTSALSSADELLPPLILGQITGPIKDVSVEVNTVDYTLRKLRRLYRKSRRRPKGLKRLVAYLLNIPHITVIVTAVVFVLVVIMWSLLWVFVFRREYYGGAYFAGMFRVANMDFIPEYRQVESHEFVSMANKLQNVVSSVYRTSPVARLYKQAIISDLSNNNKGGLLVSFWMVFLIPQVKSTSVCDECVEAILRDSVGASLQNRSSIGYLLGLPVDIDSILINSVQRTDYTSSTGGSQCVDKLYANILGASVPLSIYSSWGGVNCQVKLTSVPDSLIRLTITSFVIEPSDCVGDALTVYDALLPMRGRILHSLCEPVSRPVSIVSTSNIMLLSFRMTGDNKSFKGYFEAIDDKVCLSQIETQSDGNIYSPFYPSLLPPKCSCTWKFKTPSPRLGVALRFQNYVLKAKDIQGCSNGWWKVNEVIFCGSYVGYHTVFRIDHPSPEVEFLCSSSSSAQPFQASYSSFNISHPCPESHFLCNTGICVEKRRLCDGLDDCEDESDELFCSRPTINCGSKNPPHALLVCNGEADCIDGSDEINCTEEATCSEIRYQCRSGACILKKNAKCDDAPDCQDGSDEADCACGLPAFKKVGLQRIVGGVNAVEGEWPWQVSLHFDSNLYCGASIISSDWLVSAAHCFSKDRLSDPRYWMAYLGMLMQGNAKHAAEIQRIVVHEYYNANTFDYDIALLQLKKAWPPSLSPLIQPICLPPSSYTVTDSYRCIVTGWGYRFEDDKVLPSVLQKAQVSIISQVECKKTYGIISPRMMCAGVPSGEKDACRGDSGGPLSCQAPGGGRWFLMGIVSWGSGCGRPNLPGVYTRVTKFTPWIYRHIS